MFNFSVFLLEKVIPYFFVDIVHISFVGILEVLYCLKKILLLVGEVRK